MTDDITNRIARIIYRSYIWEENLIERDEVPSWVDWAAVTVVKELGLREEEDADFTGGGMTRYVTEWVADVPAPPAR